MGKMKIEKIDRKKDLSDEDTIDINLLVIDNKIKRFSINYRTLINDKWRQVYRVDNYHGYSHEMKFWRSPKQIMIYDKNEWQIKMLFNFYSNEVLENYHKYKQYFEIALKKGRIKW